MEEQLVALRSFDERPPSTSTGVAGADALTAGFTPRQVACIAGVAGQEQHLAGGTNGTRAAARPRLNVLTLRTACSDQRLPPRMTTGRSAACRRSPSSCSGGAGWSLGHLVGAGRRPRWRLPSARNPRAAPRPRGAGAAGWRRGTARETSSGRRAGSSVSTTGPGWPWCRTRRGSRAPGSLAPRNRARHWPTNGIRGVESWCAMYTPAMRWCPGPRHEADARPARELALGLGHHGGAAFLASTR